jgi:protein TonB
MLHLTIKIKTMKKALIFIIICVSASSVIAQSGAPTPPPPPTAVENDVNEDVYFIAQQMPVYPGGEYAMQADIAKNLPYPEEELKNKISGKLYVSFIVEKDGSVSDIKVDRAVANGPGFNLIAIDAIKKLKPFKPAKMNGVPVRIHMTVPVSFKLD